MLIACTRCLNRRYNKWDEQHSWTLQNLYAACDLISQLSGVSVSYSHRDHMSLLISKPVHFRVPNKPVIHVDNATESWNILK